MQIIVSGSIPVNLVGQQSGFLATPTSAYTATLQLEYNGFDGYLSTVD